MVDDVVRIAVVDRGKVPLCRGNTYRHAEALAERSGGDLYARGFAVLRVTRGVRSILTELLKLRDWQAVAGEVQCTVEQGRGVAVGQDEAVAVDPLRVRRIVLHELVVEEVGDGSAAQGCARVTRLSLFDG